jgi:hypothetical protein
MSKEKATEQAQICPSCGVALKAEGDLLRCAAHGAFFSYGPRLLPVLLGQNLCHFVLLILQLAYLPVVLL